MSLYITEYTFVIATSTIGCISVVTGFLNEKILFILFRAIAGISTFILVSLMPSILTTMKILVGAMTIPSALTLLVNIFPEPHEQAQAIGAFGGSGGVGNGTLSGPEVHLRINLPLCQVLGLLIGAIFVKFTSWRWVFWFIAILAFPIAVLSAFFVPPQMRSVDALSQATVTQKLNRLDLGGISLLTGTSPPDGIQCPLLRISTSVCYSFHLCTNRGFGWNMGRRQSSPAFGPFYILDDRLFRLGKAHPNQHCRYVSSLLLVFSSRLQL